MEGGKGGKRRLLSERYNAFGHLGVGEEIRDKIESRSPDLGICHG